MESCFRREIKFHFAHVKWEMPTRNPSKKIKCAVGYISVELKERSRLEIQI